MTDHRIEIHATIDGADVTVQCAYDYHPFERQTYDYPGHPEVVDLYSVMDGNVEIYAQLTTEEIEQIESDILAALKKEAAQEAYADGAA